MSHPTAALAASASTTATSETTQQLSSRALRDLTVIASYPALLASEEQLSRTPYDVSGWCLYLQEMDECMEQMNELIEKNLKHNKQYDIGGREGLSYKDLPRLQKELQRARASTAERAVAHLPGSYKLWKVHLEFLIKHSRNETTSDGLFSSHKIQKAFERALMRLHKMPRIWLMYLRWMSQHSTNITDLRRLYNASLESLPATQHQLIWPVYLEFLQQGMKTEETEEKHEELSSLVQPDEEFVLDIPDETILRTMRRHALYFDPSAREGLATTCTQLHRYGEAALLLLQLLNDATHTHTTSTRHSLWMTFTELCTHHPTDVQRVGIDFEALVRGALQPEKNSGAGLTLVQEEPEEADGEGTSATKTRTDQLQQDLGEMEGTLWAKLAEYYTRLGDFDMARSIYEESLTQVSRVRDFSILFDAYIQLEEGVVEAMMELEGEDEEEEEGDTPEEESGDDWGILMGAAAGEAPKNSTADIELALARAEHLTARRPLLLNRVLLRQNPHNIGEWLSRCDLYLKLKQPELAAAALEEALRTVGARKAINGMPSQLVLKLGALYEETSVEKARDLFDRICRQHQYVFVDVDDLAQCHAAWVELELKQEAWDEALAIARAAVASPDPLLKGAVGRVTKGLPKSLRCWDLLLDLEESLGTVTTTKDSYNRAMELKVATPLHIVNFCAFLTDHKYFEESFTAYERGVELFAFPHPGAKLLWKNYLEAFVKRFGGTKMERARDLFERCVEACPPEEASEFFMLDGKYEEEYGLTKRALSVYRAMCHKVPPEEKYTAYQLFIAKTIKYMGVPATRDIYQEAISALQDTPAAKMCLDFAKMETSLQEIERARAVLTYGAQMADPRRDPEYWKTWHEFEVSHGNEETFREMLRVKRSVQAAFSTVNYNAAEMSAGSKVENLTDQEALSMIADREGVEVENRTRVEGFVQSKRPAENNLEDVEQRVAKLRKATAGADVGAQSKVSEEADEEIDIDDIDDEEEEDGDDTELPDPVKDVSTKSVPAAVFGGLSKDKSTEENSSMGARERLRAATGK